MEDPGTGFKNYTNTDEDLIGSLFASVREALGEEAPSKRSLHQKISNASHLVDTSIIVAYPTARNGSSSAAAAEGHAALDGGIADGHIVSSGDRVALGAKDSAFGLDEADQALLKAVMASAAGGYRGGHDHARFLRCAIQVSTERIGRMLRWDLGFAEQLFPRVLYIAVQCCDTAVVGSTSRL